MHLKFLKISSIAVTLTLVGEFASPEDLCTADISKYNQASLKLRKSIFKNNSLNIKQVHSSKLLKYGFEDFATLKNGVRVRFSIGGCSHFGYAFTFIGKQISKLGGANKVIRAKSLLQNLDLTSEKERRTLILALEEALKRKSPMEGSTKDNIFLPCGDSICSLLDKGDRRVEISYSQAL